MKRKKPIGAQYPFYVKRIRGKGWGAFCAKKIPYNADFNVTPLLVLTAREVKLMAGSTLEIYWYEFGKKRCALGLGLGSIMNHSSTPNCSFHFSKAKRTLTFFALKTIPAHTELTHDYGWTQENYEDQKIKVPPPEKKTRKRK